MMKKIVLYALCALIAVGSVVPAFAAETQAVAIDDTGNSDLTTASVLSGSSTALSGSSAVSPSYTYNYNLDGATVGLESGTTVGLEEGTEVTLSDESVEALADAIVTKQAEAAAASEAYTYAYQYYIDLSDGSVVILDTNIENLLDNYHIVFNVYGSVFFWIYDGDIGFNSSLSVFTPYLSVKGERLGSLSSIDGKVFSFESYESLSSLNQTVSADSQFVYFSNRHIYYSNGSLFYESTYAPPIEYTVFFVTGFDDILLESQTWTEDFDPGTLSYDGYTFDGWYMDADFTTPYSSDYVPEADFTLYAKWIENGPMDLFHNSLFDALDALFACEPIRYIFALIFLVIIVGLFRSRRSL